MGDRGSRGARHADSLAERPRATPLAPGYLARPGERGPEAASRSRGERLSPLEIALLLGGGLAAGVVNTLAGGGSLLTVPLLVLLGLPGTVANGTNRVGVVFQNAAAAWRFRAEGVPGIADAAPLLIPVALGSLIGAAAISQVSDTLFTRLFGVVMLVLLVPTLRPRRNDPPAPRRGSRAGPWLRGLLFFGLGLYGGAFQAGVGLVLALVLSVAGEDLVRAASIKVVVILVLTAVTIPVFALAGQIAWGPALLLGAGFASGGELGARIAVRGGERVIRPVLFAAVLALAGRMLGLY